MNTHIIIYIVLFIVKFNSQKLYKHYESLAAGMFVILASCLSIECV